MSISRRSLPNEVTVQLKRLPTDAADPRKSIVAEGIIIDELLEHEVGSLGIWQWALVVLGIFSTTSASNFPVFADTEPLKRCSLDNDSEALVNDMGWNFTYIGYVTGGFSDPDGVNSLHEGCNLYANWKDHLLATIDGNLSGDLPTDRIPCTSDGYVYQYLPFQYNGGIVEDFDLVCDEKWLIAVGTSLFMVSMVIGYVSGGFFGAYFGIRTALICYSFVELVASSLCTVAHAFWSYTLLRIFVGIGAYGKLSAFNLILLDITIPRYRSLVNAAYLLGFNVTSRALLTLFAWLLREWRWMSLAATWHCLLVFTYFFLVPESPRWLLAKKRPLDALRVLERGRAVNSFCQRENKNPSDKILRLQQQETRRPSIISISAAKLDPKLHRMIPMERSRGADVFTQIFTDKYLLRILILTMVISMEFAFIFLGGLLYTRMIRQTIYIVSLIIAAVGVPGVIIATVAYRLVNHRKLPLCFTYLAVTIVLLIGGVYTYIVQPENDIALSVSIILTVMLMVSVQCMLFIYFPELYPPEVRSQGFGMTAGFGRLGAAFSTYVNELDITYRHGLPVIVYGMAALTSALLTLCLPDTTGAETRQLTEESKEEASGEEDIEEPQRFYTEM